MQIGVDVLILAALPPAIVYFLGITSYLGLLNAKPHSLVRVRKPSIMGLQMLFLNLIGYLILELHYPTHKATLVYCDNVSVVYLSGNPVNHQRTKHIELDIHFIREKVTRGQVWVLHVPSCHQIVDIFTKGLPLVLFEDFRDSLSVRQPTASTTGCVRILL